MHDKLSLPNIEWDEESGHKLKTLSLLRYMNGKACFFWDLEKLPGYTDFPIAENILHLVNNQGMVW